MPDDTLSKSIHFLAQRDGIDKVLKLIRYAAKLSLATRWPHTDVALQLRSLDSSLGTTRKALRLGKFLKNVRSLQRIAPAERSALLQALADSGEGVYYFLDQFVWLCKAGVLPKRWEEPISRAGAYAEMIGYCASITLNALALQEADAHVTRLRSGLMASCLAEASCASITDSVTEHGDEDMVVQLHRQLAVAVARSTRLRLLLLQDAADSLITLQDVLGDRATVTSPVITALCGLMSASISAWKIWPQSGTALT